MTSFKNPNQLLPSTLVEYHSLNEEFNLGYVLASNEYACLMRLVNPEGVLSGYELFDYKMDNDGTFIDKSTYIDAYKNIIKLARERGLKDTPKLPLIEKLNFKDKQSGVFTQLISKLVKSKAYSEIKMVNPKNHHELLEYDGFVEKVRDNVFVMTAIDDLSLKHTKKEQLKFTNLFAVSLGNWQEIFINEILQ